MPCAAPCDRIPCSERCTKTLACGHQCPSFCGEDCPEGYCQDCGQRLDQPVDMLEFKDYSEINVNETPIIVLGCGHFFTGETLDGIVSIGDVYTIDKTGEIVGLRDLSQLAVSSRVPFCPNCKVPIRQFATKRYNRVINRVVMDETTKRFIAKGKEDLEKLEHRLIAIEEQLSSTRATDHAKSNLEWRSSANGRYTEIKRLENDARTLQKNMEIQHQPSRKLSDAIFARQQRRDVGPEEGLDTGLANLDLNARTSLPDFDKRITLGAALISIKALEIALRDKFAIAKDTPLAMNSSKSLHDQALFAVRSCKRLVTEARDAFLVRIEVGAILAFANISE